MWDLWLKKWHWDRFSFTTSVSPANSHSTNCSTFINHPLTDAMLSWYWQSSLNDQFKENREVLFQLFWMQEQMKTKTINFTLEAGFHCYSFVPLCVSRRMWDHASGTHFTVWLPRRVCFYSAAKSSCLSIHMQKVFIKQLNIIVHESVLPSKEMKIISFLSRFSFNSNSFSFIYFTGQNYSDLFSYALLRTSEEMKCPIESMYLIAKRLSCPFRHFFFSRPALRRK
jgi:hypothetical protein